MAAEVSSTFFGRAFGFVYTLLTELPSGPFLGAIEVIGILEGRRPGQSVVDCRFRLRLAGGQYRRVLFRLSAIPTRETYD